MIPVVVSKAQGKDFLVWKLKCSLNCLIIQIQKKEKNLFFYTTNNNEKHTSIPKGSLVMCCRQCIIVYLNFDYLEN